MSGHLEAQPDRSVWNGASLAGAIHFFLGSVGFAAVLLSVSCAIFAGPSSCFTLAREWGSWCGTEKAAASLTLLYGGAVFIMGASAGAAICRRFDYLPRLARFLALVTITVSITCFVLGAFILPLVSRLAR